MLHRTWLSFGISLIVTLSLFALLAPSFWTSWQSVSAVVEGKGFCRDNTTGETFNYILEAHAPAVHIAVDGETGGTCTVPLASYRAAQTPGNLALSVNNGVLVLEKRLSWNADPGLGLMGRMAQGSLAVSAFLGVCAMIVLAIEYNQPKLREDDYYE